MKLPLTQIITFYTAEAGFVVKIDNAAPGAEISGQFLHSSPVCLGLEFFIDRIRADDRPPSGNHLRWAMRTHHR